MDLESNTDFDISESWSLFDLNDIGNGNDAEDSGGSNLSVDVVAQDGANNDAAVSDATKIPERCENGSRSQEQVGDEIGENGTSESPNATSPGEHCKDHQDFQVLYKGKVFQEDCDCKEKSSDCNCSKTSFSDTGKVEVDANFKDIDSDSDSISVISEDECNEYRCSVYENVEVIKGNPSENNLQGKTYPNVLKRKKKRLKLNYKEGSDENVTSDVTFPDGAFPANIPSANVDKISSEVQIKDFPSAPVYRHYRNNMANTILSLAMGIIFAGVACIALGHFLGVHDAQQTVGEMMETLKKLQMENVILQSRMSQLSRDFLDSDVQDAQHTSGEMLETLKRLQMKNMMLQSRMNHEAASPVCEVKESGGEETGNQMKEAEAPKEGESKRKKESKRKGTRKAKGQSERNRCRRVRNIGDWYAKRAKARERFRYDRNMGDWQFERAKRRDELRKGEEKRQVKRDGGREEPRDVYVNWQFKRALGRENIRNNMYDHLKKKKL